MTAAERSVLPGGGSPDAPSENRAKQRVTALANEKVDAERKQNNLPPLMSAAEQSNPKSWGMAMDRLEADPSAGEKLVAELVGKYRTTDVVENALLLHRKIALQNEHERSILDYLAASREKAPTETLAALDARERQFLSAIDQLDSVTQATGTEMGRAFQFRKQLAAEDFRLSAMIAKAGKAKGQPLSVEEMSQIAAMSRKIAELQAKLDGMPDGSKQAQETRIDLKRTKNVFFQGMEKDRLANQTIPQKVFRYAGEMLNLPRSILTAFDFSAVFRQGAFASFGHPIMAAKALPDMFKSFVSERAYDRTMDNIMRRPNADWYKRSELFLADSDGPLSKREESFMSRLAGKVPGVAGSERAYNAFLNRVRADMFDSMTASLGEKGSVGANEAKVIAGFINAATGRGDLGVLEKAAVPLATVFFSPRYTVSRFQLLSGQPLMGGTAATRKAIAKEYARFAIGLGLVYAAAKLAGGDDVDIEHDPRSADFGKIRIGRTRLDPMAGLSQAAVFTSRMLSGQTKTNTTVHPTSRANVLEGFTRNKLAPIPGAAWDARDMAVGRDPIPGHPETPAGVAGNLTIPIAARDVAQAIQEHGLGKGTAVGLTAIFGIGTQVHGGAERNQKSDALTEIYELRRQFLASEGKEDPGTQPPAIAKIRDAALAGDQEAFDKAMAKYVDKQHGAGLNVSKTLKQSLHDLDPLIGHLSLKERNKFFAGLSEPQKAKLELARQHVAALRERIGQMSADYFQRTYVAPKR